MSERRYRPPNRWGCKPTEDVCVQHDSPLECPHGCIEAAAHECKFKARPDYAPSAAPREDSEGK